MAKGNLIVNVYGDSIANPVKNAKVIISKNGEEIFRTITDSSGQTAPILLDTVDKNYTYEEQYNIKPYETYDLNIESLGLTNTKIKGVQIFDGITSFQDVYLTTIDENKEKNLTISDNTLWGDYPPNTQNESNQEKPSLIVLKYVTIPSNIIVHDGIPSNSNAANYTVPFKDYIKNVASSEIYSTWPYETIKANVLAIISFTLNRIYTEWYKNKGYNFTITSTTSYDQKYTRNGTIFEPISKVVDEIFNNYIRKGLRLEPLLAYYRSKTSENGYLSQWGSKDLGDKGYSAIQILKYYYGDDINIYKADVSEDYPYSFTKTLKENDCNPDVYILQNTLNYIRGSYPKIPIIKNPSGYFDTSTTDAVKTFQSIFSLPQTGQVNYETWYQISYIFTAVSKMANSVYS